MSVIGGIFLKKRLRKKMRIKEFFEPHIAVHGTFDKELSDIALDMYIDNLIYYSDTHNLTFWGITTKTSCDWLIYGKGLWRLRLKEHQIQDFLHNYYHSRFIKGEHTVTIHRGFKDKEVLVFKGWADYVRKV